MTKSLGTAILAALVSCTAFAADHHPLVGTWAPSEPELPGCVSTIEFRDDGSVIMADGDHRARYSGGPLAPLDRGGVVHVQGTLVEDNGKAGCFPDHPAIGAKSESIVHMTHGGDEFIVCAPQQADMCLPPMRRRAGGVPRPARVPQIELADALAVAIENAMPSAASGYELLPGNPGPAGFVSGPKSEQVDCEEQGGWRVQFETPDRAAIFGNRCADGARVAGMTDAAFADPQLKTMMAEMATNGQPVAGFAMARETLANGVALAYFPVIAVGHGIIPVWTVTLVDKARSRAIVVQATTMACDPKGASAKLRICTDPQAVLTDIGRTLASSLAAR